MAETFKMLGEFPPAEIAKRLRAIGDIAAAEFYEQDTSEIEESRFVPHRWLYTRHQYGFIPPFEQGKQRYQPIISATNMLPDETLKNQRVDIRLDLLRAYDYPRPLVQRANNIHTILFTFEASNEAAGDREMVAFNQTYHIHSGQNAAIVGCPIFIGLKVGSDGIKLSCQTVHVSNSSDKKILDILVSPETTAGLHLLTTIQPALAPFIGPARNLGRWLVDKRRANLPVQDVQLGLDFDKVASGARLAVGSYVVAQLSNEDELNWGDWSYDADNGSVMRTNLAPGEQPYEMRYNTIIFRVSKHHQ